MICPEIGLIVRFVLISVWWHVTMAMLSCYRPPGCTMAPVKDHSTLTLGAIHSEINRKIIYPLMADHTNQFHSNNEMFPNMRLWCEFEWEAPDPWSGDWGTAPSPRLPCEGCVANVSLIYTRPSGAGPSIVQTAGLMSLMSFCFTQRQ